MSLNLNAQIIWVFVDLLILFVLMKKFLFEPITRMLDDRAQEVSDTLDQADRRLAEAEQQQTAHAAQLASAKAEAAQIIEDARARGQQEYDRLVAEARTAVQRLEEQSAQRRESERAQMLREAKKELAALVLLTTAKVSRQTLDSDTDCAAKAVALCAEGRANFLMKGILGTADLMRAVFNKEHGLRTGRLTTHCMFYEIPALGRMIILTDGGVNTFPDLEKKANILENAAMCFRALGYETIHAACICGAEQVNPKIQSTVDADALAHMTDRWAKYGMDVCGPVALDLAVSPEACRHKHYSAPGAGMADILLVPNYEVGNGIGKAATLFGGAKNAGIILGAKVPIVLVSRSDSAYSKLASIAAGSVLSRRMQLS